MEINGTPGADSLRGTSGADDIYGYGGDDTLLGLGGDDWLEGGAGANYLDGGSGNDVLDGGEGNDVCTVMGGAGNDLFYAIDGNEILIGGDGNDDFAAFGAGPDIHFTATGGAGIDRYFLATGFERSFEVTDFATGPGGDEIDLLYQFLLQCNVFFGYDGGNPFDPEVGYLRFEQQGGDAVLLWDFDGAGGLDDWFVQIRLLDVAVDDLDDENLLGIPLDGSLAPGLTLTGTTSGEFLLGDLFDDSISAGGGADGIDGSGGNDLLDGGPGHDTLYGAWGDDTLLGGTGNDELWPEDGFNRVEGGDGADRIVLGSIEYVSVLMPDAEDFMRPGATTVVGGAGRDVIVLHRLASEGSHAVSDFQAGANGDLIDPDGMLDVSSELGYLGGNPFDPQLAFLRIVDGGAGAWLQWDLDGAAGSAHTWVTALAIDGVTAAAVTAHNIVGGFSPDGSPLPGAVVEGSAGNDELEGTGGDDTIQGKGGNDLIDADVGADLVDGGTGHDTLVGGIGNDTLIGGAGDDWFDSLGGLLDTQGDDSLVGGDGDDAFYDEQGHNTIEGGAGDDWFTLITFDGGSNTVSGGAGVDTFHPSGEASVSVVTDFEPGAGGDLIYPTFLIGALGLGGEDPIAAGYMRIAQASGNALLQFDEDGPGTAYGWVTLLTLAAVQADEVTRANFLGRFLVGTAGPDLLVGDWTDDVLQGLAGDDSLDGGGGRDTMEGGLGNDLYYVDDAGDVVVEEGASALAGGPGPAEQSIGSQVDKVVASVSYSLGDLVEDLRLADGVDGLTGQGNALANVLEAGDAGSVLQGHGGNDTLLGAGGIDTARYAGARSAYAVARSGDAITVTATMGSDGTDVLHDMERIVFGDASLAFDFDGNAALAARLLGAVFGPPGVQTPAYVATCLSLLDAGMAYEDLMQAALVFRLGANPSHAAVVDLLYANVVGSPPAQDVRAAFTGLLENGTFTQASLGVMAAGTSLNAANIGLDGLAAQGLVFG